MRRARLALLFVALLAPATAAAQWQLSADLGAAHLEQSGLGRSNAAVGGLTFDFANEHALLRSSALGAVLGGGESTGQWMTIGSAATPSWKGVAVQGTGTVSLFGQSTLPRTTSADATVQLRVGTALRGLSAGGGFGRTSLQAGSWSVSRGVADAWWVASTERVALSATFTRATVFVFDEFGASPDGHGRYLDLSASWEHTARTWSMGAATGLRSPRDASRGSTWTSANAMLWVAPHVGVTLEAGSTLDDLVRGVPGTHYVSLGMKLVVNRHAALSGNRRAPVGPRLDVARVSKTLRLVYITLPSSASRVELMADFTDWAPVLLNGYARHWRLRRVIAPGPHRLVIRIDGGDWIVPTNLPSVDDELGGRVGLLTTP